MSDEFKNGIGFTFLMFVDLAFLVCNVKVNDGLGEFMTVTIVMLLSFLLGTMFMDDTFSG